MNLPSSRGGHSLTFKASHTGPQPPSKQPANKPTSGQFCLEVVGRRPPHRLTGLVVKASTSGAEDPGFKSRLRLDFFKSSHTSDLNIGTPVGTLPGAWRYRVSAGTGQPGVSML